MFKPVECSGDVRKPLEKETTMNQLEKETTMNQPFTLETNHLQRADHGDQATHKKDGQAMQADHQIEIHLGQQMIIRADDIVQTTAGHASHDIHGTLHFTCNKQKYIRIICHYKCSYAQSLNPFLFALFQRNTSLQVLANMLSGHPLQLRRVIRSEPRMDYSLYLAPSFV